MDNTIVINGTIGDNMGAILECASSMSNHLLIGAFSGAILLPILVWKLLMLSGFTEHGMVRGSIAAMAMAYYDGYIPVGGFMATMQSIGSMGSDAAFNRFVVVPGCFLGMALGGYWAIYRDYVCNADIPE
ncbi:MAG: hypothetical protein J3R72DRAFT_464159 [Linnemannia gamsii]|nr:MAG: hypothetical protein J3R72DRAFT_464159 [Linnemannia gamsii]